MFPQQHLRRSTVRCKKCRNTRASVTQPLVPDAQSTQVPHPPPLLYLRISAPLSNISRVASPPLPYRPTLPAIAQQPASVQTHVNAVRKQPRTAARMLNAVENSRPTPPPSPLPPRTTRSMNSLVENRNSRIVAMSTTQYSSASAASAVFHASYCYAVALRSYDEKNRKSYAL